MMPLLATNITFISAWVALATFYMIATIHVKNLSGDIHTKLTDFGLSGGLFQVLRPIIFESDGPTSRLSSMQSESLEG